MPVGVISSSASTTPTKPAATPSRKPGEDDRAGIGQDDLDDLLPLRAEERAAHQDQRGIDVAHRLVGVEHDDRQRQDHHGQRLCRHADAVDEGDQRDEGGDGRRLQHDEDRDQQPLAGAPQAAERADADAEEGREQDAEDERLQRREIGLRQAAVGDQADKGDEACRRRSGRRS